MGRWTTRLIVLVGAVLAVGVVALGGLGGYLYWTNSTEKTEAQVRNELPSLAIQQIPVILGFDYQTILATREQAYAMLTPDFKREYETDTTNNVVPQARAREVISQVNVVGAGTLDARRNSGSVMVFMNRTITDKSKQPLYDGSRLRVDYQRVDGDWRISDITPI